MGELLAVLGWLGVVQAVLVAAAVLTRRGSSHPAVPVLGALLLAGAGALAAILLSHDVGPHWELWVAETVCTVVGGPLVYAWVARTLEDTRRGRLRIHLVIPAAFVLYQLWSVIAAEASAGTALLQPPVIALVVFQASYTTAAAVLLALRWHEPEAVDRRGWLASIVASLALVHVASFARWLGLTGPALRDLVPAAAVLLIYAVSFVALRQPRLLRLVDEPAVESATAGQSERGGVALSPAMAAAGDGTDDAAATDRGPGERAPPRRRYETSSLRQEQVTALRERLVRYLATERPYLRTDLTLPDLAAALDTLPTHLSRAVNETGEGFPELLARYRIEEAKGLLRDPELDHLTVEALGRRAGFGSRSAFHDAFRRRVGTTPSAFRRDRAAPGLSPS